jgi:ATP-dependent RNA circularization protein (DNA/RNA ligase family)
VTDFYRFPHTPHLLWLGAGQPRADKVLTLPEARAFLDHEVVVEEKIDGANVGFSLDAAGELRAQNRGAFLDREATHPQFKPLFRWLDVRQDALAEALFPDLMLFGEWCYAVHSIRYTHLPDWFVVFDVFDRATETFWSTRRRDDLAARLGLAVVPHLGKGRFTVEELPGVLAHSRFTDGRAEGIYIRQETAEHLSSRAKVVSPEFVQAIEEHWTHRAFEINGVAGG